MITTALLLTLILQLSATVHNQNNIIIYAELKHELSSRRSRAGQRVTMVALEDVKAEDGSIAIPAGAKLTGKITLARKRQRAQPAALAFVLENAKWKGHSIDVKANIEQLELMANQRAASADMPYLRGGGGYPSPANNSADDPKLPPSDCKVEKISGETEITGIVCRDREVELGPGGRMYLVTSVVQE